MTTMRTEVDPDRVSDLDKIGDMIPVVETRYLIDVMLGSGHSRNAVVGKVGRWLTVVCKIQNTPLLHTALAVLVGVADLRRKRERSAPTVVEPPVREGERTAELPMPLPPDPADER